MLLRTSKDLDTDRLWYGDRQSVVSQIAGITINLKVDQLMTFLIGDDEKLPCRVDREVAGKLAACQRVPQVTELARLRVDCVPRHTVVAAI